MLTTLKTDITVKDVCKGFVYNELEGKGLFGLSGKLTINVIFQKKYKNICKLKILYVLLYFHNK